MDEKDRLLLYYLDKNSRTKESDLAKHLKVSKQVVNYRIKRLVSEGIIKEFQTILNLSTLDLNVYSLIYCTFLGCSNEKEKKIIDYLLKNPKVSYLGLTGGKYDFYIVVVSKSLYELDATVSEILAPYAIELRQHTISLRTFSERLSKKYLVNKSDAEERISIFAEKNKHVEIDSVDKDIIKLLAHNARIPLLEVAEKLNLPFSTVRNRLKMLEKNKVIAGYSLLLDLHPINMLTYKILIKVSDKSEDISKKVRSFSHNNKHISWFAKTLGTHDFEFRAVVENIEQFQQLLKEMRSEFSDFIESLETIAIFKELKEDYASIIVLTDENKNR